MKELDCNFEFKNVLVYDSHPVVCNYLKIALSKFKSINNITTTSYYYEANSILSKNKIDLLILDVCLDRIDGFQFLRNAKLEGFKGKSIFISSSEKRHHSKMAQDLGASACIYKHEDRDVILQIIGSTLQGYEHFGDIKRCASYSDIELSNKESTVLKFIKKGKSNTEISNILSLSPKTISTYKRRILNKYGVSNIFEVIEIIEDEY